MRIFITGATGFVGSRVANEILAAGHEVIGLTRSEAGAQALQALGAEAHLGTLENLDSIREGAKKADAVIHTAFDHNFANFLENCEKDKRVIEALGSVLKNSDRPLIITSGVGMGSLTDNDIALETVFNANSLHPRIASELAGNAMLDAGVDVRVVRLPQVHNTERQGLISPLIDLSREKGVCAYIGDGSNRWSAAHVSDVAKIYRLVLEKGTKGQRYHAVAEEGVSAKEVVTVLGEKLSLPVVSLPPEEMQQHFGWQAMFIASNIMASSAKTRQELGWAPVGPTLLDDLKSMN